jgi:hypothetical protein
VRDPSAGMLVPTPLFTRIEWFELEANIGAVDFANFSDIPFEWLGTTVVADTMRPGGTFQTTSVTCRKSLPTPHRLDRCGLLLTEEGPPARLGADEFAFGCFAGPRRGQAVELFQRHREFLGGFGDTCQLNPRRTVHIVLWMGAGLLLLFCHAQRW